MLDAGMEYADDVVVLVLDGLEAVHVEPLCGLGIESGSLGLGGELAGEGLEGLEGGCLEVEPIGAVDEQAGDK